MYDVMTDDEDFIDLISIYGHASSHSWSIISFKDLKLLLFNLNRLILWILKCFSYHTYNAFFPYSQYMFKNNKYR